MSSSTIRTLAVALGALGLVLTGCSGNPGASPSEPAGDAFGTCADVDLSSPPAEPVALRLGGAVGIDTYAPWFMMTVSPEDVRPNAGTWYTLENVPFTDPSQRISALQSGQVDGVVTSMPQMLSLGASGIDVKIVAAVGRDDMDSPSDIRYVVAADSDIKDLGDLAGGTIATIGLGSASELLARMAVEEAGLAPDDVTYAVVPPAQHISSVEAGTVDVALGLVPFLAPALESGSVRDLGSQVEVLDNLAGLQYTEPISLAITDAYLEQNPEVVCAYLADYRTSLEWLRENQDEARTLFSEEELIAIPAEVYLTLPPSDWPVGDALPSLEYYLALAPFAEKYGFIEDGSPETVEALIWTGLGTED